MPAALPTIAMPLAPLNEIVFWGMIECSFLKQWLPWALPSMRCRYSVRQGPVVPGNQANDDLMIFDVGVALPERWIPLPPLPETTLVRMMLPSPLR